MFHQPRNLKKFTESITQVNNMNKNELHKAIIEEAARSDSFKRKVGAAVVLFKPGEDEYRILALGHNHRPGGGPLEYHNENNGRMQTYEDVIHAEQAALNNVDRLTPPWSVVPDDYKIGVFVTHDPCDGCLAAIRKDGIDHIEVVGDFLKFDTNKLRYDLVPPSAIAGLAEVLTYGAKKYKPNNWRNVKDPERYIAAAMRHFEAYRSGEEHDPESGLPHLAQVMTNIAFLYELDYVPEVFNKGD